MLHQHPLSLWLSLVLSLWLLLVLHQATAKARFVRPADEKKLETMASV